MSSTQSTLSRQLVSSIVSAQSLLPSLRIPEAVAKKIKAHREMYVARMAQIIADEYESLPIWIDGFCHECDMNECARGTAQELAAKMFDLGWTIEGGPKGSLLLCPSCTCGEVK